MVLVLQVKNHNPENLTISMSHFFLDRPPFSSQVFVALCPEDMSLYVFGEAVYDCTDVFSTKLPSTALRYLSLNFRFPALLRFSVLLDPTMPYSGQMQKTNR